ncbi:MAG: RNA degradosome polyphosphate kinase [Varibaculum sp.]|nr:RNA degradosome polyphosphate kinase [Varibaculum sp.]
MTADDSPRDGFHDPSAQSQAAPGTFASVVLGGVPLTGHPEEPDVFETALADELVSPETDPEQYPGREYDDADYEDEVSEVQQPAPVAASAPPAPTKQPEPADSVASDTATGLEAGLPATAQNDDDLDDDVEYDDEEYDGAADEPEVENEGGYPVSDTLPGIAELTGPFGEELELPAGRYSERELTWLQFNERVLEQAEDPNLGLLERAWFATIFSSNLDEFYMVRVAGLKRRIAAGIAVTSVSGLTPRQVMDGITARSHELCARQAKFIQQELLPQLNKIGVEVKHWDEIPSQDAEQLHRVFRKQIFPVLTPLAVDPSHPFPYISGLSLNMAVVLRNPLSGKQHFARVKVPDLLPRMVNLDEVVRGIRPETAIQSFGRTTYVPLEDVISAHLDHLFPGMEIVESCTFRVTRNENMEVEEDDAENLLTAMEAELLRRRFGPAVRLEVSETVSNYVLDFLVSRLGVSYDDVFKLPEPLDPLYLNTFHDLDLPAYKFKNFVPATPAGLAEVESATPTDLFAAIRDHDVLLHHPYDSFATSVQLMVTKAARDPRVKAIKQTLYRTSSDSPIVSALIEAAQNGKQVLAIVEIKARFDEDANISWARKLETAGVHVVYGMVGLKTHCKLQMVVREDEDGVLRRYCHVGTGNYHPKTARGYEDLGLLTCDAEVAQDMTRLFNQLSGYAPRTSFHRLLVAPRTIRPGLLERIQREIDNRHAGRPAAIHIKVNSLVDEKIIDALYRASQAGVPVTIVCRGICTIRAGIPGLSDNIRVRSILGRFLEHSRIYAFENAGEHEVWIGSADLMHRNLDRRVEALVRVKDPEMVEELYDMAVMEASDEVSSWWMLPDGSWQRHTFGEDGSVLKDVQELFIQRANSRVKGRH